ncbi:PIN domain-containing protein [Chiayiivirga flava]|uniref:Ribonuclease VapC n=1 Tax=Chiayiivirga flava TaxID=659595 RepID=A0A7W8D6T0_9GAMM|nr:PIN domain-containing protein [Chiayiivirga flava]MBB5208960.1 hypothetical protein [Chiayiivirga flava]
MSALRPTRSASAVRDQGPAWGRPPARQPFLLSVDLVLALLDPAHALHDAAHRWFEGDGAIAWATCPLVENSVIRICSHPSYPNSPGTSNIIAGMLDGLCNLPGHRFWPDSISLRDPQHFRVARAMAWNQTSDIYLLGLAVAHGGRLATFDRRLDVDAVLGGADAIAIID